MAYDDLKEGFGREPITIVEIDLDYCSRKYGSAPCAAVLGETGSAKCFNTLSTCQDPANYDRETKTYRHCEKVSFIPEGMNAIPDVKSVSFSPAKVDPTGGLGVRGSVSITIEDHPGSDLLTDKYQEERISGAAQADGVGYNPLDRGTYWGKLRARNPYYQQREIRVLTGYITGGVYDPENFQQRVYLLEKIDGPNSGGTVTITAKDPLKSADGDRSQAPKPSQGSLSAGISAAATSFTLAPTGVGDSEYPASGYVRIGSEVMSFTRAGDVMTVTRAQYNTEAKTHNLNDTVQLCLEYSAVQAQDIVYDLMTNYAGISTSYIDKVDWDAEADEYLTGLYSTLITEPEGVNKLLKEIGEQAPHYVWWDERFQKIRFQAVKPPGTQTLTLSDDQNLLAGGISVKDEESMRLSQVWVYFGQVDPTEDLSDVSNFRQVYVRANLSSESEDQYRSSKIKKVYSRWITEFNKAAAVELAASIGRRFGRTPQSISFNLDPKDSDLWTGDVCRLTHRNIQSPDGGDQLKAFQILQVQDAKDKFAYQALEYIYDSAQAGDPGDEDLIIIGSDAQSINLRSVYDSLFNAPENAVDLIVRIEAGVVVSSVNTSTPALDTGTWPVGSTITIENNGFIVGKGAPGRSLISGDTGEDGGNAISMMHDLTIDNSSGVIGGGGGGGGAFANLGLGGIVNSQGGGGGAGFGILGASKVNPSGNTYQTSAENGGLETGGAGSKYFVNGVLSTFGGNGGDLGEAGGNPAADYGQFADTLPPTQPGNAIVKNGNTLTFTGGGTAPNVRGNIV